MDKAYTRIFWENTPSTKTALGATNLNRTDYAINEIDNRVIKHDVEKADKAEILNLVNSWTMDEQTGIITVTKVNGERLIFDLNIEKIPVNFELSPEGILTMTTADGTQFTANIGAMIPVLEFESTDTIAVFATGEGVNKTYSFSVKDGSITADKLQPDYLADVTVQAENASAAATAAADSAKAAKDSETNAAQSAADAAASALAAQESKVAAAESEAAAKRSEEAAAASQQAAASSETAAKESETAAKLSETNAAASETNAAASEQTASAKAEEAADSANLSKSYAVGGTGTRDGEDTDNSEYYSNQSKEHLNKVESAAENAIETIENALKAAKPEFVTNVQNGHLYYKGGRFFFLVDENGHLRWRVMI